MGLQKTCINVRGFTAWLACIFFGEVLAGTYTRSVLTSIERRFELPSTITAFIASSYQIGNLTVMILVSYMGSRVHRPRFLAFGSLLLFTGYMLVVLPQFLGGLYEFTDISTITSNSTESFTCTATDRNIPTAEACEDNEQTAKSNLYILIIVGIVVCGIGGAPTQPLGLSYVDDHSAEHNSALYIGIITTIALVGPAFGYVMGSFFLKIWVDVGWVDLESINISPQHQSWVGAWWLGFIVCAVVVGVAGIPLWFYPSKLDSEEKDTKDNDEDESEKLAPSKNEVAEPKDEELNLKGIVPALVRLFTNPQYVLTIVIFTTLGFKIAGIGTFIVKYLEVGFGKSAAQGSFLIGAINLPFLIVGTLLGSIIIKKWQLEKVGIVRLILFGFILSFLCLLPTFFIGCDTISHAGLTMPYPTSSQDTGSAENSCNSMCHCNPTMYTPVCGPDNITYVSPCYAGCTEALSATGKKEYKSCSCLGSNSTDFKMTVGRCLVSNCEDDIWYVIVCKTLANFFSGLVITGIMILKLRCVSPQDKSFGIGIGLLVYRLLAAVPSPIIFGSVIDSSCLFWSQKPCSNRHYCTVYDNHRYRRGFIGLILIAQAVAIVAALFLHRLVMKERGKYTIQHENEEEKKMATSSDEETEECSFGKETIV
ncbi:solute carrier organic anion transporter family member 1C1-like [Ciona intestinalis]